MSALSQPSIEGIKRLMHGADAADVAGWAHALEDQHPDLARLHFQTADESAARCTGSWAKDAPCKDNVCLLAALKHFYGKVVSDEGRKLAYPPISIPGSKFSDADMIKMLINLIGDLHQPLHMGFPSDEHGRKTPLDFFGDESTLYHVMDEKVHQKVIADEADFWWSGWTRVDAVRNELNEDKAKWSEDGAFASFERWVEDAGKKACELYDLRSKGSGTLSPTEYGELRQLTLQNILVGGARLSIVLNDILDAKGASKLSDGTLMEEIDGYQGDSTYIAPEELKAKLAKQQQQQAPGPSLGFVKSVCVLAIVGWLFTMAFQLDTATANAEAGRGYAAQQMHGKRSQ
jgi:hypothetical protein